jgi:hypothetical protein
LTYLRVTITLFQLMLPAISIARMITWFDPTSSGTGALHCVVPEAVPAPPVFVDQVTLATPERSEAVPLNVSDASVVTNDVLDG